MGNQSKHNSTENLKVTYFLGAGASFQALPIWKEQGKSMINVATAIFSHVRNMIGLPTPNPKLYNNEIILEFSKRLMAFGELAQEYGSIDIYARRLYLLGDTDELNELKKCLSVYFDIWENFIYKESEIPNAKERIYYQRIDKRYFSLLSVILEKTTSNPELNKNVSFITWNYDLQLEMAYESFLKKSTSSIKEINHNIKFMEIDYDEKRREVFHLNGFRGVFYNEDIHYETVEKDKFDSIQDYLLRFLENFEQFKNQDYTNCIKYAWESDSDIIGPAKAAMAETNILVIIGYSFPAFNRKIDTELIKEFEKGTGYKKVIYQDPYANQDIINSLFSDTSIVELQKENTSQFYIPQEFLSPLPGEEVFI